MKKLSFVLVLVVVLITVLSFTGCKSATTEGTESKEATKSVETKKVSDSQPQKETYVLKASTSSYPEEPHTIALNTFAKEVERLTDGQIKVEVFDSSTLIPQDAEIPSLKKGTVGMVYTSANWLAEFVPELTMFSAAYTFKNYDHMTSVLNGDIGKELFDKAAEATGVRPLAAFYMGSRIVNLRSEEGAMTPSDLKGVKLRMPNSAAWMFLGEALGANPTPLAFSEVYLGLQSGTIDGQDNPANGTYIAKFYEVTNSLSITNHLVDSVWPAVSEKMWNSWSPELQGKVIQAVEIARIENDKLNLDSEEDCINKMRNEGLNVVYPDIDAFRDFAKEKYLASKEMSGSWDLELYDKIQEMAK